MQLAYGTFSFFTPYKSGHRIHIVAALHIETNRICLVSSNSYVALNNSVLLYYMLRAYLLITLIYVIFNYVVLSNTKMFLV